MEAVCPSRRQPTRDRRLPLPYAHEQLNALTWGEAVFKPARTLPDVNSGLKPRWRVQFVSRSTHQLSATAQITSWCGSKLLTEHRDKCAGRTIAGIERGIGDRLSCNQALHRVDKPCTLAPSTER